MKFKTLLSITFENNIKLLLWDISLWVFKVIFSCFASYLEKLFQVVNPYGAYFLWILLKVVCSYYISYFNPFFDSFYNLFLVFPFVTMFIELNLLHGICFRHQTLFFHGILLHNTFWTDQYPIILLRITLTLQEKSHLPTTKTSM